MRKMRWQPASSRVQITSTSPDPTLTRSSQRVIGKSNRYQGNNAVNKADLISKIAARRHSKLSARKAKPLRISSMPDLESPNLLKLTAKLVVSSLRGNSVSIDALADLIRTTHTALTTAQSPPAQPALQPQPAISVRKSIRPDAIVCLECGKGQKMLKRHLSTMHGLTVEDYKARWSLPSDYPMTAPDYASVRSTLAKKAGLGRARSASHVAEETEEAEPLPASSPQPGPRYPQSRWSKPTQ